MKPRHSGSRDAYREEDACTPSLGEAGPSNWWQSQSGEFGSRSSSRRRRIPTWTTILSIAVLAVLPVAAIPPRDRPPVPTYTPPPQQPRRLLFYDPNVDTTPALPTETIVMPETILPFVVTQLADGSWTKIENGWSVFGRQAGPTGELLVDNEPTASATETPATTWAIEQTLPTGWGTTSNRTNIYKVPLISAAAVIMAIGIVAGIIIYSLHRRKVQRRAKRREERKRRKELAAAGLTEDDIVDSAAAAAFEEKLKELESSRRKQSSRKSGTIIRTKVRAWQGLRRRKGKKAEDEVGEAQVIQEDTDVDDKSIETPTGTELSRSSTTSSAHSLGRGDESTEPSPTTTTESTALPPPDPIAHFPPAYRPASVRSLRIGGSSSTSAVPPPHPAEKTVAPGYYPAPVSADAENALAVASRMDGKVSMATATSSEERERDQVRHVATDDKRELERIRLAASAPGVVVDESNRDGPSAPHVDIDESGFERHDSIESSPRASRTTPEARGGWGELLPPPQPIQLRSFEQDRKHLESNVDETLDELNLIPSAPPVPGSPALNPSAPPIMDEESSEQFTPSAPDFVVDDSSDLDGGGDDPRNSIHTSRSRSSSHHSVAVEEAASNPAFFLPKYEP